MIKKVEGRKEGREAGREGTKGLPFIFSHTSSYSYLSHGFPIAFPVKYVSVGNVKGEYLQVREN